LDGSFIFDKYHAIVQKVAATRGLDIDFVDVYHSQYQGGSNTSHTVQISKNASQATRVNCIIRDGATAVDGSLNSYKSDPLSNLSTVQWRLGSQLYPADKLDNDRLIFKNTLSAWDDSKGSVPMETASITPSVTACPINMLSQALELSSTLNLSGQKVNNAKQLELRCVLSGAVAGTAQFDIFLEHVKMLRVKADGNVTIWD
jgi:hypothetical protein